uniref:Nucleoporin NUP42 n=1 Tax=Zeugodacus cucurbitae TaxID=28588 RepID=A0A0A1WRI6_ZEUCU
MVLCRFFLQGSCRFGTKCNNEHLDVKQLVKTDLEGAINGKQWPISCFGPFKDKPCIPSFIEDQSFEEIRWLCYEAKQKNCVEQYVQHFSKEVMEANNKMKTMLQLPPAAIDIITRLYDAPTDAGANTGLTKGNVNNPFGLGGNVINDSTSIFNKPSVPGNSAFGGAFGNNATNVGQTPTQGGGIFGGGGGLSFNSPNQQSSIFSQQLQKPVSVFGGGGTQGSLFGQTQTNTGISGGLFGQTPQATGNLFAQTTPQQQQTQPTANVGLFAQQPQTGSLFGQQNQTQTAPGGNLFNQNIQQQQPNGGNIFAQAMQSQQQQPTAGFPLFQANKPQTNSVFGQQSVFAQQSTGGMFGQMAANTPANNANNLFTQPVNTTDTNGVFKNTQNIFAQAMQQQQQTPQNMFSQAAQNSAPAQTPSGFFQQNVQSQQMTNQHTAFGQQMGVNNASLPLLQSPVVSSSVYSKLEDLTTEDIEAFKADTFTPGRIPNVPPPRELIN